MDAKEMELRGNAMLRELRAHLQAAVDRSVVLAATLAVAESSIKSLQDKYEPKEKG